MTSMRKTAALPLFVYFGSSAILHLLWEILQMPLYQEYDWAVQHYFLCCIKATAGDLFFMLAIYLVIAVVHQDIFWIKNARVFKHPATWIIALVLGGLIAISNELWAVYVDHRWAYAAAMPIIPILHVGLTPFLQMLTIPQIALLITRFSADTPSDRKTSLHFPGDCPKLGDRAHLLYRMEN